MDNIARYTAWHKLKQYLLFASLCLKHFFDIFAGRVLFHLAKNKYILKNKPADVVTKYFQAQSYLA